MLSCGMYDYAGEWAYRVGMPAKSGVGGGIVGVVPGQFGIGIFSPPLDAKGNSVRGIQVCQELSQRFGLHAFETGFTGETLASQFRLRRGRIDRAVDNRSLDTRTCSAAAIGSGGCG